MLVRQPSGKSPTPSGAGRGGEATRSERLEIVHRLSLAVVSNLDEREVFAAITKAAVELFGDAAASLWVLDGDGQTAVLAHDYGVHSPHLRTTSRLARGQGLVGRVIEERRPLFGDRFQLEEIAVNKIQHIAEGFQVSIIVPLLFASRCYGALAVRRRTPEPSHEEDVELLGLLASYAAITIDRAQLFATARARTAEAEARLTRMRRLTEISHLVSSSLDRQRVLDAITEAIFELLGGDVVRLWASYPNEGVNRLVAAKAPTAWRSLAEVGATVPITEGVIGWVIQHRQKRLSTDLRKDPVTVLADLKELPVPGSRLTVPLLAGDRALGAFSIIRFDQREFTPEEQDLLDMFAATAATAIENAHLYAAAQQALADLKGAQDRLMQSAKFRALAEMAGGVAHDFNNRLAAILGRSQHLLAQLEEGEVPRAKVQRNLTVIERAALDGAETVRRLLEYTQATPRGGGVVEVNVNELLVQVVEVSRHRWKDEAERKGTQIRVVLEPGEVPPIAGNPAELSEVLLNLVFNAVDAMPEGGTITLSSWAADGTVSLRVRDTGIGMTEETRQRIFDPFFTTKGPQASGLGLSASFGIIQRHRGEIVVDSRPGQGATLTVKLPAQAAAR
jgi:signal transduction histidine kinase